MDVAGLILHTQPPVVITAEAAILPGAFTPLILPLDCLPAALRGRWLAGKSDAPLAQRVAAALDSGDTATAWELLRANSEAVLIAPAIEAALGRWVAGELKRLDVAARGSEVLRRTPVGLVAMRDEDLLGLRDTQTVLASLAWPRWIGPVVCVDPGDPLLDGRLRLARPALPVIAIEPRGGTRRSAVAAATARLALDLTAPPPDGWPAWVISGAAGVCAAVARGEGPSPRAMLEHRQRAGIAGLEALFTASEPAAELATAVCAYLLHSGRRQRFAALLDPLRHGADAQTALRIAYGVTVADLIERR